VQLGPPNNNPTLLKLIKHLKRMKKTTYMLVAIAMSLGSMTFAQVQAPDREGFAPDANPNVKPPHGAVQHDGEQPKPEVGGPLIHPRPPAFPTFEQWIHGGKKIPSGLVFTGGTPRFDESTGKDRSDEEVYKIIFPERPKPETGGPDPKPEVGRPEPKPETGGPDPRPEVEKPEIGKPRFPAHWGRPPALQTKDLKPLPGDFGMGSSTLVSWIERNIKSDHSDKDKPKPEPKRPPVVRPPAPPRPEISHETKNDLAKIETDKADLFKAMREELGKLEKDSSKADVRKAVEEFKKENADKFAAIKKAADKVHKELEANRPERKERPEPPAAVKAKIDDVKAVEKTLHVARKAVNDKLKEAHDELAAKIAELKESADKDEVAANIKKLIAEQAAARKIAIDEFRDAQKEKHEELKVAQKELRKEVRNTKEEGSSRTSR